MNNSQYRRKKKKKQSAMGVFTLLIMLVIAVAVILLTANMLKGGTPAVSGTPSDAASEGTSVPPQESGAESKPDTSETASQPAVSEPSESKPETSTPDVSEPATEYTYKTDVSDYLWAIEPTDREAFIFLVNYETKLASSFVPENLTAVRYTRADRSDELMVKEAEAALYAFLNEAKEYGYDDVTVTSAYRSYAKQSYLFENKVERVLSKYDTRAEAEDAAATEVARPGTSEHQSGLTCDMHNMSSAQQSFGKTDEAKWLAANAYKFGFILRFPEDKQDITKIIYEPWHFRFVGRYHATQMKELGMCLEEYTEYLNNK